MAKEAITHRFDLAKSSNMKVILLIAASFLAFLVSGVRDDTDLRVGRVRNFFQPFFNF